MWRWQHRIEVEVGAVAGERPELEETGPEENLVQRDRHRLQAEGRLLNDASGENTDGFLNFQPIMDTEKLLHGYRKLLENLYSQKSYYQRINTFLRNYRPTAKAKVTREDILAFLRSIWQLGIKSKARFHYWRLISKTFVLKRKAVPMAVELAIFGQHFEQILQRLNINQALRSDKK